jgi:hypothetical protein
MLWIAVNHHGLEYVQAPIKLVQAPKKLVQADYMVFWDSPESNAKMLEAMGRFKGMRVSPLAEWSDVDLSGVEWWRGCFSSHLATWLACWMGCNPVLLAGMDCYQGPRPADANPRNNAYKMTLEEHLECWRPALEKCPHAERIRAVSGPLVRVFGKWEGKEINTKDTMDTAPAYGCPACGAKYTSGANSCGPDSDRCPHCGIRRC